MNHLLLDLAKVKIKWRNIPFAYAKVGLFATFKAAKRMTAPEEPHSIYVLPGKRASYSIIAAAEEILLHHPDTRIVIVSPRKKLRAAIADLQDDYPEAELLLKKRLSKTVCRFIKNEDEPDSDWADEDNWDDETDADELPPVFTLLHDHDVFTDTDFAAALLLLKKNRPKKKTDLVRLLAENTKHDDEHAHTIVSELQQQGVIAIDAAETVRYR